MKRNREKGKNLAEKLEFYEWGKKFFCSNEENRKVGSKLGGGGVMQLQVDGPNLLYCSKVDSGSCKIN